jgi:hypothetical protein
MGAPIYPLDWRKEWNLFAMGGDLGLAIVEKLRKHVETTLEVLSEAPLISTSL